MTGDCELRRSAAPQWHCSRSACTDRAPNGPHYAAYVGYNTYGAGGGGCGGDGGRWWWWGGWRYLNGKEGRRGRGDYCGVSAFCNDLEGTMIGPGRGEDEEPEGNAVTPMDSMVFLRIINCATERDRVGDRAYRMDISG